MSKSERTTQFILETVAPIFNKNGYAGTSLSDITAATGLTKGAVYGNFESKEELALKAFNYNVRRVFNKLTEATDKQPTIVGKLKAITQFYRGYSVHVSHMGGCPLLNVGVDTNHQNELLHQRVQEVNLKLKRNMANLLEAGKASGEIRSDLETKKYAGRIIAMLEGSIYMTFTLDDNSYITDMMDHIGGGNRIKPQGGFARLDRALRLSGVIQGLAEPHIGVSVVWIAEVAVRTMQSEPCPRHIGIILRWRSLCVR